MPRLLILGLTLVGVLLSLEIAIPAWRNSVPISKAAVFSLPMAKDAMQNPGHFQQAIDIYHADRGAELKLPGPDGTSLTVFYFEWDQVEASHKRYFYSHNSEYCITSAGFTLESRNANRTFKSPVHPSLVFDAATFADPGKRQVYVYKVTWVQGLGVLGLRDRDERSLRFKYAFDRGRGAARFIECGIFGAQDENQAWQIFQDQVLQHLSWPLPKPERGVSASKFGTNTTKP